MKECPKCSNLQSECILSDWPPLEIKEGGFKKGEFHIIQGGRRCGRSYLQELLMNEEENKL